MPTWFSAELNKGRTLYSRIEGKNVEWKARKAEAKKNETRTEIIISSNRYTPFYGLLLLHRCWSIFFLVDLDFSSGWNVFIH
jgi:hypothetical protein